MLLPSVLSLLSSEMPPQQICQKVGLCSSTPLPNQPDFTTIPTFIFDLDQPAANRWQPVTSNKNFTAPIIALWKAVQSFLSNGTLSYLDYLGNAILSRLPVPFPDEITGGSDALGIPPSALAILNLAYDLSDACTSILARRSDGTVFHARNLDFLIGLQDTQFLRTLVLQLDVRRGGRTLYKAVGFPLYSGILTAFKKSAFSLTVNTRFLPKGPLNMIQSAIEFLLDTAAVPVTFLTRQVAENASNFAQAYQLLTQAPIISDVYYTLGGFALGEGAVITRDRSKARDEWPIVAPAWYVVQTNYDHWMQPPVLDNRVVPAEDALNEIGADAVSVPGLLQVLSTKPVLNLITIHSIVMSSRTGDYAVYRRFCEGECSFKK